MRYLALFFSAFLAAQDGGAIYKKQCALCHDTPGETRAPAPAAMRQMSPENILASIETGSMKEQGAALTAAERRAVAAFLGRAASVAAGGFCPDGRGPVPRGTDWNSWGADLSNMRFQRETLDVSRLKLKWAFGFPGLIAVGAQPVVVGGQVFVGAGRKVYALDAASGCIRWTFDPGAPVRAAVTVAGATAYFGDGAANMYAVDAATGALIWKNKVDDQAFARITGAPQFYDGRLYAPISVPEDGASMNPKYECCRSRGAVVAVDAASGKVIWRTYSVADTAKPTHKSPAGTQLWGPSGASIWPAPTLDLRRKVIYAGTGDNHSRPITGTSDAVLALNMETGKLLWSRQLTAEDAFNMACVAPDQSNCPDPHGPDYDVGASPILLDLPGGRRVLIVAAKSAVIHGLDPDRDGEILWKVGIGRGGALGGVQWGPASDGQNVYAALSDIAFASAVLEPGKRLQPNPKTGGGLFALRADSGKKVWYAPPAECPDRAGCSPAQSAAVTAIPGVVFSGSIDGHLRAYSTKDGRVIWDFDTARDFATVNGVPAKGGSMDGGGPAVAGKMVFVNSGYGNWGGLPGNVLLAFSVDGK